jgi:REP element-mobilizing transposase RayT
MEKEFYVRNLPHYHPKHATFSIVFRLAGSLPKSVIDRLKEEHAKHVRFLLGISNERKRREMILEYRSTHFEEFDSLLDTASNGPYWLREEPVAQVVADSIRFRGEKKYELLCYCIMPNHVHLIIKDVERSAAPLYKVLQSLKSYTSRQSNLLLQREGAFWQEESYDHVVRTGEELERTIWYVLHNPAKAGLVDSWEKWKWSYVKEGLI